MTDNNIENIPYVSLHNHTHFSLMDSLISPLDLFNKTKELGGDAVAITDHGSLAAMWDGLQAMNKTGIKLIPGCEFYFVDDVNDKNSRIKHIILLSYNEIGYSNLLKISAEGYDNSLVLLKKVIPRIDWNILEKYNEGLICTTACGNGILSQLITAKKFDEAEKQAIRLKELFGDNLAIELQAHAMRRKNNVYSEEIEQVFINRQLRKIAEKLDIKPIVTTNAHYLNKEEYEAQDVMLSISSGQLVNSGSRLKYNVNDFYVKSGNEVFFKLKRILGDEDFARKCMENTIYFANKCEKPLWIDPKYSNSSGKELPEFPVKDQPDYKEFKAWVEQNTEIHHLKDDALYYRFKVQEGLNNKLLEGKLDSNKIKIYQDRIAEELDVLEYHGFSSYMLIVWDYINWAKANGISVGPGRGSCGGVFTGYLLGIHQADSIKYNLIFARFHNKEKSSFPDLDIDIAPSGRDKVKAYLKNKYGEDHFAHVSNMNTLTPKVYARAIARVFMYGGDRKKAVAIGTAIADSIPNDIKYITDALEKAPLFAEYAKKYPELSKYAKFLDKKITAWSTHAGGIIVSKRPLRGLVPIRRDADGNIVLEYEKERAEANGLVKMDVLGLETLDIIENTIENIKNSNKKIDFTKSNFDYNKNDEKAYSLMAEGNTFCVFQLGTSGGTIDLCKRVKPKSIEDISIINSLARPSAKDIRGEYVAVRNGEKPANIMHPSLERAFRPTLGFGLYEECLMFLAQDVAGWNLNKADGLRKLTKEKGKNPEKAKKLRQDFINDSINNNIPEDIATRIWDEVVDLFQGYGFNASHSVLYSMTGFFTAYLKAHYPLEFLVANLQSEINSNAKIADKNKSIIKEEIKKNNVKILPPNINTSEQTYKIIDDNTLLTGFEALKFMGKDAIPEILSKRPFSSFEDFLSKVDGTKVRIPAIQALAGSGSLDCFNLPRKVMYLYAADFKKKLQVFLKNKTKNPKKYTEFNYPFPKEEEWSIPELYALEMHYLGEGLTGNRVQVYKKLFNRACEKFDLLSNKLPPPPENMDESDLRKYSKRITVQAIVKDLFEFKVKKENSKIFGEVMAKVSLEDPWGNQLNMTCFPDGWTRFQEDVSKFLGKGLKLEPGIGIHVTGDLQWFDGSLSLLFSEVSYAVPAPQLPDDLKPRKVSMPKLRLSKQDKEELEDKDNEYTDPSDFLEEMEDELIESGLIDIDSFDEEEDN
jgi:DNA polymerase-3 subunit alpha